MNLVEPAAWNENTLAGMLPDAVADSTVKIWKLDGIDMADIRRELASRIVKILALVWCKKDPFFDAADIGRPAERSIRRVSGSPR